MNENNQNSVDKSDSQSSQDEQNNIYSGINSNDFYPSQHKIKTIRLSNGNIASFTSVEALIEL